MFKLGFTHWHLRLLSAPLVVALFVSRVAFAGQALPPQQRVQIQQTAQSMEFQREDRQKQEAVAGTSPLPASPEPAVQTAGAGPAPLSYKKKIVASAFNIDEPGQVEDINDIANGFPRELLGRLQRSGKFLVRKADSFLGSGVRGETPSLKMIRQLADANDSQFVLSGTVRSAEMSVERKYLGLWNTDLRDIEVELTIYDGNTGSLIATHRLEQRVQKNVLIGREKTFGSKNFFSTSLGKAIDEMLNRMAEQVDADVAGIPLSAKVLRVNNGQILLDAGAASAIAVGDVLSVYRLKNEMPLTTAQQVVFGASEVRAGTVSIAQVQPLFSIGELSEDARTDGIKAGDIVRMDPRAASAPAQQQ
ncbi:flagella assembly protein FlgT middle domain-containing protein [Undibacterium sp.]|uniref:flagella assembly protein FlgT middle domain-containing protein n=1 Tax=Undibacterium sp. TaxID=1914977 RepID=UPI002B92055F|nr:flagella assembly protein FlgT middle domain-containing protein [Undibacterium sp.]HTD07230.1 flagella assembly protein FlgT middle domain-containing protein [Undibacterium sp.]